MLHLLRTLFAQKPKDEQPDFNWRGLKAIDYISVVRVLKVKKRHKGITSLFPSTSSSFYYYKLNLVIDNKKRKLVTLLGDYDKNVVFKKAFEVKAHFRCRIFDCTSPQKQWID